MSGKDRTGMEDVMLKFFLTRMDAAKQPPRRILDKVAQMQAAMIDFKELDSGHGEAEIQAQFRDILLNSANLEVQAENTGYPGFKLVGENSEALIKAYSGLTNVHSYQGLAFATDS